MSDPTVVGIPVGGADTMLNAANRVGTSGTQPAAKDPAPASHQPAAECPSGAPRLGSTARHAGECPAPASHQPALCKLGSPEHQASRSHSSPIDPVEHLTPRSPIFHPIGEPVRKLPPVAALDSHVEVGIQGTVRKLPRTPSKTVIAQPAVRRPGRVLAVVSAAAVVIGSGFLLRALTLADPVPPPVPPAWASRAGGVVGHRAAPLGYARPTRVTVARVGIHADMVALGVAADGGVAVPPVGEPLKAGWYDRGPAPGQAGPAVITGHVDSRIAPGHRAAFYELGAVRPGDAVDVARADHRVAVFRVDSVALVPKAGFPTREVYGATRYAALRLITGGGHYDRRTGYADNVIVYAHLVGSR